MPPRSSSRKKSNRHNRRTNNNNINNNNNNNNNNKKKKHFTSQSNRHSSPASQSQGEVDANILREQNGRKGYGHVNSYSSEKWKVLVVEEEENNKKGVSDSTSVHNNEMEGSVEEIQKKFEEYESEDKEVVGVDEEKVKTIVESDVLAEPQKVEAEELKEEEKDSKSELFEAEKDRDASEVIVDDIKELEAELKQEKNEEGDDSQEASEPPLEQINEPSLALETEESREEAEAEVAVEKLESSEEKKEESLIERIEALVISESSVPETDVASRAIDLEATPVVEPEESGETKLPIEEQKLEESTVVRESSKEEEEEAGDVLPPSDVATAESTGTTLQEKTGIPTSAESQQSTENPPPREFSSWSSCCGIFDFLCR